MQFLKNNKKTISIFVSHQGCPNDCIFCNQKKITGVKSELNEIDIRETINSNLETIKGKVDYVEIAFFGGSFTAIEDEKQLKLLNIANEYIKKNLVHGIRISTRPDSINQHILDRLKKYGVNIIELGVQSMDIDVLNFSKRGHDNLCVFDSSNLILKNGFQLGLQMMIGLPYDSKKKVLNTINNFIDINPNFVRIYPVVVIKDTELEILLSKKLFEPWDLNTVAELSKMAYISFKEKGIDVIRIGLQSSDNISLGKDVIAGPYHPAFGEIVYSLIYRDIIDEYISNFYSKYLNIEISNNKISQLIGHNKSNIKFFKEKYGIDIYVKKSYDNNFYINNMRIDTNKYYI